MIAILGGTGPEGLGLAVRFAAAGLEVAIGSRDLARAEAAAADVLGTVGGDTVRGDLNSAVCVGAKAVFVAVPFRTVEGVLTSLQASLTGTLVVSVVATVEFVEGRLRPVAASHGSAAQQIAQLLPDARVASGLQTLSAEKLRDLGHELHEDTIVCSDDRATRREAMALIERIAGLRALDGGRLANSYYPEQFVGMLAALNRIHKAHAGLRIVDV